MNNNSQPLIGFCVSENIYSGLRNHTVYRLQHVTIDVPFIRFEFKNIDFKKRLINGEKFNENTASWEKGIFPFPSVVYIQCAEKKENIEKIEKVIGPYVFNNFIFNKWEGYNLLKNFNHLYNHLPNTQILQNKAQFTKLLFRYKDIIIKPTMGWSSQGIYRIKVQSHNFFEILFSNGKDIIRQEINNLQSLWESIPHEIFSGTHIIQQAIETIKVRGNVSDIRLNMNKDKNGQWQVSFLIFRISTNNSVVIPYPKKVFVYTVDNFIKSSIYDKEKMGDIEKTIIDFGLRICNAFDQSGNHMADLGIDLGLDDHGHLWIFEVNPLPFPNSGTLKDYSLTRPVDYALYLISTMT